MTMDDVIEAYRSDLEMQAPMEVVEVPPSSDPERLAALAARVREGRFPKLLDMHPTVGADLSWCENLADGAIALGNDYAGNYFVLMTDGTVDLWCHDEGGYMEGWEFASIDELLECLVLVTVAKERWVPWDTLRRRFEEGAGACEGWAFYLDDVEEYFDL